MYQWPHCLVICGPSGYFYSLYCQWHAAQFGTLCRKALSPRALLTSLTLWDGVAATNQTLFATTPCTFIMHLFTTRVTSLDVNIYLNRGLYKLFICEIICSLPLPGRSTALGENRRVYHLNEPDEVCLCENSCDSKLLGIL
jgi:hypothetical protein